MVYDEFDFPLVARTDNVRSLARSLKAEHRQRSLTVRRSREKRHLGSERALTTRGRSACRLVRE